MQVELDVLVILHIRISRQHGDANGFEGVLRKGLAGREEKRRFFPHGAFQHEAPVRSAEQQASAKPVPAPFTRVQLHHAAEGMASRLRKSRALHLGLAECKDVEQPLRPPAGALHRKVGDGRQLDAIYVKAVFKSRSAAYNEVVAEGNFGREAGQGLDEAR